MSSGERSINIWSGPDSKVRLPSYYSHQSLENYMIFSFFETENWKPGVSREGNLFLVSSVVEWGGLVHIESGL